MLVENGIVRVGAEIEVAAFRDGVRYQDVAVELLESGHLEGDVNNWLEYHQYNCSCRYGCSMVKRGDLLDPPLVSIQYDASLPKTGAEFIVSPVLLLNGMAEMRNVWNIVTRNALWTRNVKAMRGGGMASPSIHLHVSAVIPKEKAGKERSLSEARQRGAIEDVLAALSLFGPEMILLSDVKDFRRGLAFRQPWRHADGRNRHHGFIDVKQVSPGRMVYIEWRMFEAAYKSWEYLETGAYLAGALTRALLNPEMIAELMVVGYQDHVDEDAVGRAIAFDDTVALLGLASENRLRYLRDLVVNALDDDDYGRNLVAQRFEEVLIRV